LTVRAPASGPTASADRSPTTPQPVLAVQDFTVTLSPYNPNTAPVLTVGGTQSFAISSAGLNGFTGNIGLGYVIGNPQCILTGQPALASRSQLRHCADRAPRLHRLLLFLD
jgi:hypothetical protein